ALSCSAHYSGCRRTRRWPFPCQNGCGNWRGVCPACCSGIGSRGTTSCGAASPALDFRHGVPGGNRADPKSPRHCETWAETVGAGSGEVGVAAGLLVAVAGAFARDVEAERLLPGFFAAERVAAGAGAGATDAVAAGAGAPATAVSASGSSRAGESTTGGRPA